MKIIISRKGFDSVNGGMPSPIMPDGMMLSMPIPSSFGNAFYSDLSYNGTTYKEILNDLKPKRKKEACCHLDPDIRTDIYDTVPKFWQPIFGQCDSAELHLENKNVGVGDLFMFFGLFRQTEEEDIFLRYKKLSKEIHALYGYLQVGKIERDNLSQYYWHPHSDNDGEHNTMYLASAKLMIDGEDTGLPGAGVFRYSDDLMLTMPGMVKSRWKLPEFFKEVEISYHSKDSFKPEGYFQTVRIGQEFVVSEDARVTEWAKEIILKHAVPECTKYEMMPN